MGKTTYKCQCQDFPEHFPPENPCRECKGTGEVSFDYFPFEANLANGNAHAVQEMLKMPTDYCGSCDPSIILEGISFVRALNNMGHEPLVTPTTEKQEEGHCRVINCGRSYEQVERYLQAFEEIALEAARRKVPVVWA